ncbi:MAG: response regulator [Peptococcaceae bacterium]|nr:response regulator [Peptococcaceae bacterium]
MKTVLIADDSAFMRKVIRRTTEKAGFRVVGEAENGLICIEKYKELRPEIVTLDVTMAEMDGREALAALMEINPKVKVLMVSALGQESIIREAILIGAADFIIKPFKEIHLISALNGMLLHRG